MLNLKISNKILLFLLIGYFCLHNAKILAGTALDLNVIGDKETIIDEHFEETPALEGNSKEKELLNNVSL